MTTNLFTFVSLFRRIIRSTRHVLEKGVAHAEASGLAVEDILDWRLIDDMHPLRFQVAVVCNFSQQWTARVVGLPAVEDLPLDVDLAGLWAGLSASERFLDALTAEQFAGRDDVPLTVSIAGGAMEPTLPAAQWLTVFAATNLYFHMTTAYDILRSRGVQLGKIDLFTDGL